jgi:hypothetical protein
MVLGRFENNVHNIMLPTIEAIYFVQKSLLVVNRNGKVKCPELTFLTEQ